MLAVIAVVVGLTALAIALLPKHRDAVVMPDGTVWTLEKVSYGQRHEYASSPFRWLMPWQWAGNRGRGPVRVLPGGSNETLMVWLREQVSARAEQRSPGLYVVNSTGRASARALHVSAATLSATERMHGFLFTSFPRRQGRLQFQLREASTSREPAPLATFEILSPVRLKNPPRWQPAPLPTTVDHREAHFTLVTLTTGVRFQQNDKTPLDAFNVASRAVFRVLENGRPSTSWELTGLELLDAPGNFATASFLNTAWTAGDLIVNFRDPFWPEEPVWRLRGTFARTRGFAAEELWTVRDLDVAQHTRPRAHEGTNEVAHTERQGTRVVLRGIEPGRPGSNQAELKISLRPVVAGVRLTLVEARDQDGQELKRAGSSLSSDGNSVTHGFYLKGLPEAKTLSVTLAIHASRVAEFVAAPEVVAY